MLLHKYATVIHEKLQCVLIGYGRSRLSILIYTLSTMFWLFWNLYKSIYQQYTGLSMVLTVSIPFFVLLQSSLILFSLHLNLSRQPKNKNIASFIEYQRKKDIKRMKVQIDRIRRQCAELKKIVGKQ